MSKRLAIVMAAGQGTRMKSDLPKVLVEICNRPMIHFVLDAIAAGGVERAIIVVGYRADAVRRALAERPNLAFVEQTEQLGTGHAVQVCRDELAGHDGPVLIVTGDSPLTMSQSVATLFEHFERQRPACVLGTLDALDPSGLGRIVRDGDGQFQAIVEQRDTTDEQRKITEVNMSTYVFDSRQLLHALGRMSNDNDQGEYYITDCPGILKAEGKQVLALPVLKPCEALSINTFEDLRRVEDEMRKLGY